ncbi:hypothetical protein WHR41_05064 [Cladosporium halotolerans]|uniref:Uncharacterized protein n=1 Tax=Cladosporium halotolerans TaxID=1052096 RepID=A0AB34KR60_9PEZI
MPTQSWTFDLQGVRALAHEIYCSCQEPSSSYRPLARSVRSLRNRLEEADEALGETPVRPEDVGVFQAVGESGVMLEKFRQTLQDAPSEGDGVESGVILDLLNDVDEVTRKLTLALEAVERPTGRLGLIPGSETSPSTRQPGSLSTLTSNSDDGVHASTASSSWSFSSNRASFSQRLSARSDIVRIDKPEEEKQVTHSVVLEEEKQVVSGQANINPHSATVRKKDKPQLHLSKPAGWAASSTLFDVMSVDIDQASSYILADEPSNTTACPPAIATSITAGSAADHTAINVQQRQSQRVGPHWPLPVSRYHADYQNAQQISRSTSVRTGNLKSHESFFSRLPRISSASQLPSVSNMTKADFEGQSATPEDIVHSLIEPTAESSESVQEKDSVVGTPSIGTKRMEWRPLPSTPTRRTSRARGLFRPARAIKSRYVVVNPDIGSLGGKSDQSLGSGQTSAVSLPTPRGSTPGDMTPASPVMHKYALPPISPSSNDNLLNAIINSWNSQQWSQAKLLIEHLLQTPEGQDQVVARKLRHLQGILASLTGNHNQALLHLASVFEAPITHPSQINAGHCAAAHWMADIYLLQTRRAEAFLAYSLAARNPIFRDAKHHPLRDSILAEQQACFTPQIAKNLTHAPRPAPSSLLNPSLLNPSLLTPQLIQTLLQPLSPAPTTKTNPLTRPSLPLTLTLKANALHPTTPFPLPADPLFNPATVLAHTPSHATTTDLLSPGTLAPASLPKKIRPDFACPDLRWLVLAVRKGLAAAGWEGVETTEGTGGGGGGRFVVRYCAAAAASSIGISEGGEGIAEARFFSVVLYRLAFRPGYGVEVAGEGVWGSRSCAGAGDLEEGRRVRGVLRGKLEGELRRWEAAEGSGVAMPVVSINGVGSLRGR